MHFYPKGRAICRISQQIIFTWRTSNKNFFRIILFLKKVIVVLNFTDVEGIRIHCFLLTVKKVPFFHL